MNLDDLAKHLCDIAWENGYVLTYKLKRRKCCNNQKLSCIDTSPVTIYCGNCKYSYVEE